MSSALPQAHQAQAVLWARPEEDPRWGRLEQLGNPIPMEAHLAQWGTLQVFPHLHFHPLHHYQQPLMASNHTTVPHWLSKMGLQVLVEIVAL